LTADSLHVGHLIPIMMLRCFSGQAQADRVDGCGTSRIGDPSFRDTTRRCSTTRRLKEPQRYSACVPSASSDWRWVNGCHHGETTPNGWTAIGYIDFLRDFGRHFSVNRMLTFDSVRQRLAREQSLSLLEFNYMSSRLRLLVLARTRDCRLQLVPPTSGETSSTASSLGAASRDASYRADRTAPHHFIGSKDGQEHVRCGLAQASGFFPYDSGSSGAQ